MAYLTRNDFGRLLRLIFLLSSFTLLSCAQGKPHSDANQPSDAGGDVSESVSPPAMFPHLENWQKPSVHGAWVVQYGKDVCLSCHKSESKEKGSPPTCRSCHAIYPHAEGWVEDHGPVIQIQGKTGCATQCHGLDLKGGLSKISCNDCHITYPHPAAWSLPEQHGKQAEGVGKELCRSCHGSDLKGGRVGVSCYPCHQQQYPHATDWEEKHGAQVLSQGTTSCQTGCHGLDLKGGRSGIACTSCHKIYPHEPGWKDKHPVAVGDYGKKVCQGCHGEDFKKVLNGKNCFSCHKDYPHPEKGVWDAYSGGHGERVQKDHDKSTESCELCHGDDLQTMKAGQSCFSCHPSYPHKKVTTEVWKKYEGHGEFALSHSITECQLCHGANYQGGDRKNPSCYQSQCHVSYPHNQGWLQPPDQEQGHGIYVGLQSSASCATARCHGEGLVWSPETSHGPSCDGCHKTYPHIAGWKSGVVHGPTALADVSICKECHTPTLDFASPGFQTCKECHPSYLQHKTAGIEGPGWGTEGGHPQWIPINPVTKKREIGECQLCHGANYQGGLSKQSCQQSSCHESYPHQALMDGTKWLGDAKQPQGHGKYLPLTGDGKKKDASQCQGCHGVDYNTSVGGNSCKGCHANYPHTPNWGDPTQHGVFVLKDLKKDKPESGKSSCQKCHGDNLQGGITGKSCFGGACHAVPMTHEPGWGDPVQHGMYVIKDLKKDKTSCKICHGEGLDGGAAQKSCFGNGCHEGTITHADGSWQNGAQHGNYLLTNLAGDKGACQKCHTTEGDWSSGGVSGKSCQGCHPSYPHKADWKNPTKHGIFVLTDLKNDKTLCNQCHSGPKQVSCAGVGCHTSPTTHNAGWKDPTQHGMYVLKDLKNDKASCKVCHGDQLNGGAAQKSCFGGGCHEGTITHSDQNWKQPNQHGQYLLVNLGNNKAVCQQCHATGGDWSTGGGSGKSCQQCHAAYPHTDVAKAKWLDQPSKPQGHGNYLLENPVDQKQKLAGCQGCHGANYDKLINGKSCRTCHNSYPHTLAINNLKWFENVVQPQGHGQYLPLTPDGKKKDASQCQACHGANYDTVINGQSCKTCHPGYPHSVVGWEQPTQHGNYVLTTLQKDKSSCQSCHGNDLKGGITGKNCYQAGCHTNFTHQDNQWKEPSQHGLYVIQNLGKNVSSCKVCHGAAFNALPQGKNCYDCHENYPHKEFKVDWSQAPHGQAALTKEGRETCKKCHGATLTGDNINTVSCWGCHTNFPHVGAWTQTTSEEVNPCEADYDECWQTITHVSSHADEFLTQKANGFPKNDKACSLCHGQDYQGGNSKVACGPGCHDKNIPSHVNYPHTVVLNWNPDGQPNLNTPLNAEHGKVYLAGKPGTESSCHLCHTNLGSGPDSQSPACNSCHQTYPHGGEWVKGSVHGYKLYKNNKMAECKSCHGPGLDQNSVPGGKTCQGCHVAYLQHNLTGLGTGDWGNPKNHGGYYIGPLGGQSACKMCHGKPELAVEFTPTDTKGSLAKKSFCYQCHWTYPHIGFDQGVWEPVVTNQCGPSKATNLGHIMFVVYSPLVATAAGENPVLGVTPLNSPLWGAAIGNTCGGGTGGSCHFDGYRSYSSKDTNGPCGSYCHGPTKPPVPKLPDCPPTPPVDPCKNDPALCEE